MRSRGLEGWRKALRQISQGIHEAPDIRLCDNGALRRYPVVPADRVLSQANELSDRYLLPVFYLLLHPLLGRDCHTVSLLVRLGCDANRRQEDISYFPWVHAELLCFFHHDRAELLGHVPGQSSGDCRGDGYGTSLGRDMESDLVAGEHSPSDCERGARRLYLRRICGDSLSVCQDLGRARPLRLDGLRREFHRCIRSVGAPVCRLLAHAGNL